ncbi:MAG TPA: hypothetical protein VK473_00195 [Terriglobales bacterium]|nr:hypothetical protein [Terriglobales bacterium]
MRSLCIALNLILAAAAVAGVWLGRKASTAEEAGFLFVLAVLFLVTAVGLIFNNRWIAVLAAIPLAVLSAFFAFLILVGGWVWAPQNVATMYGLILGGLSVVGLEVVSVLAAIRLNSGQTEA